VAARGDPGRFADLFIHFGPVSIRRMFGGEGLFAGEVMIGLVDGDRVFFKTDEVTRKAFKAEGCKPFVYRSKLGKQILASYYALPDRLYDEPDELAQWARAAYAIASTSPTAVARRRKREKAAGLAPVRAKKARRR
jgi:DNA transformation protein